MKTYTYMLFLRHPVTGQIQQGTIEIDSDGEYLDFREVLRKLNLEQNLQDFEKGYTLIGMNIVDVQPSKEAEWSPDWPQIPDEVNCITVNSWGVGEMWKMFNGAHPVCGSNRWYDNYKGRYIGEFTPSGFTGDWKESLHYRNT